MDDADAIEALRIHRFLLGETNVRLDRFREAIANRVKPGDTVLDLGTGTGVLAFFACLAGARRVYAVETGPVIELARLLARENGFEDRIVFLNGASHEVELPGRVDVLVTDTFGLWRSNGVWSILDARDRFLTAGGILIPQATELFVSPVDVPDSYQRHIEFWTQPQYGIDLSAIRPFAIDHCYPVDVEAQALLSEPASIVRLNFSDMDTGAFDGEVCLTAGRSGTLHGLCVWFANDLGDGIVVSNRPGATTTNYSQGFFPVARPVPLDEGDRVKIGIRSYDSIQWRWQVDIQGKGSEGGARGKAQFDHSTFWGFPMSAASLGKLAPDHAPKLSARGEAERFLLGLTDGGTAIANLEERLLERYPELFKSRRDATVFVAGVVSRCA